MKFDLAYKIALWFADRLGTDLGVECGFCGSLSLVAHGLLDREVRDLDLMLKGNVNDSALLGWVAKHGRWHESAAQSPESIETMLKSGRLSFVLDYPWSKKREQSQHRAMKIELFLPGRYPFNTLQGQDVIDFTYREIVKDPRGGMMAALSPDGCILWKILMGRSSDKDDLNQIRDRALRLNRRLKLDEIERQLVNVEGMYGSKFLPVFRSVFRDTSWIRSMSGDADDFRSLLPPTQAGAFR